MSRDPSPTRDFSQSPLNEFCENSISSFAYLTSNPMDSFNSVHINNNLILCSKENHKKTKFESVDETPEEKLQRYKEMIKNRDNQIYRMKTVIKDCVKVINELKYEMEDIHFQTTKFIDYMVMDDSELEEDDEQEEEEDDEDEEEEEKGEEGEGKGKI
jgi:hypothetical protein